MNIFVTDPDPRVSAQVLPDKHIVKMPLETCQMASVIFSKYHWDWGTINKKDGTPYRTTGGFRNHPCTVWAASSKANFAWMLHHGFDLMWEYQKRFGKEHGCFQTMCQAMTIYHDRLKDVDGSIYDYKDAKDFARAMPDEFKYDDTIDTFTAYKRYIASKPWVKDNYRRIPERKPDWI
jgi:hypothetical protein|tara:strand:+ start:215 stop:748 length:534 start_codon:yes stop_codon:yes gene_type:complete